MTTGCMGLDFALGTVWFRIVSVSNQARTYDMAAHSILKRVALGEDSAVEECLDQYGGLVWSLARKMFRSNADAEDAVQEIFVEIWKNAGRYDESQASEATFIAMIARRRLIDKLRKRTRRPEVDSLEDTLFEPVSEASTDEVISGLEAREAAKLLKDLRPEQRKAIYLSVIQGYSHSEVAEALDMPLGTVKTHIRRGLIETRKLLGFEEDGGRRREVSA